MGRKRSAFRPKIRKSTGEAGNQCMCWCYDYSVINNFCFFQKKNSQVFVFNHLKAVILDFALCVCPAF